ncbi:MAG: DUF4357 domain-containing protein [Prevotella sp.]|nr:DUF4357 domain-containing protein [Prevotella sp.]
MQEKWNQFVYDLCEAKNRDVDEDIYHNLIENQLQLLGWAKWKGEICHKPNVPIGNSKYIQPDILIKNGDEAMFVIEVKRPVHSQTERERVQLESYMRQQKIEVGVYVGEHIEVFYDRPKSKDAVSVLHIPLEMSNKLGAVFVAKFSKEYFTKDAIIEFCEERIQEMQRQASLNKIKESLIADAQVQIMESLKPYLLDKYGTAFSEEEIMGMLSRLKFIARDFDGKQTVVDEKQKDTTAKTASTDTTKKRVYDYTEYSLDGGTFFGKNKFVYAVVTDYVKRHPEATFEEIERVFPPALQGSFGVVRTMEYIKEKKYNGRRYFKEPEFVLKDSDGIPFAVSTEWGKDNIEKFLKAVRQLGYHVTLSSGDDSGEETKHTTTAETSGHLQDGPMFHLYIRDAKAHAIFNETDHSMRILKGSLLPQSTVPSYRDGEKRNAIIAAMSKPTKDGFWELQQDYVLNSPSTAASYCSGRSTNGWEHWINDEGQSLDELYRSE